MAKKKTSKAGPRPAPAELDARVLVVDEPLPLSELRSLPLTREMTFLRGWLGDGDRELVLASGRGPWLFLWIVDVERQTVRQRVSVPAPTGLECMSLSQNGDRLWVAGNDGVFEISRRDWRLGRWLPYDDLAPAILRDRFDVLPGTSYLWLEAAMEPVAVLDLESRRVQRPAGTESFGCLKPVLTPGGTLAVVSGREDRPRLYRADGTPVPGAKLPRERWVWNQAVAPDGEGFVQLMAVGPAGKSPRRLRLKWLKRSVLGSYRRAAQIELPEVPVCLEHRARIATSFDLGLCFVLTEIRGRKWVLAYSLTGDTMREVHRFQVPATAILVQDRDSWCATVAWLAEDGLQALALGSDPPLSGRLPAGDSLLMQPWLAYPPEPGEWAPQQALRRWLVGAIRTADRARRDGDLAAALAALDRPLVWASAEIQCLARLAVLVLESPARTPEEKFRKRLVLSHFDCLRYGQGSFAREIQGSEVCWEAEELDRLVERGRAWLGRQARASRPAAARGRPT